MVKIIGFKKAVENRNNPEADDLNSLLKRASVIKEKIVSFKDRVSLIKKGQLQRIFEGKISQEIINMRLISREIFLCGIYVSNLLEELALSVPESWWAIDYSASHDPQTIKKGGDICFIKKSVII